MKEIMYKRGVEVPTCRGSTFFDFTLVCPYHLVLVFFNPQKRVFVIFTVKMSAKMLVIAWTLLKKGDHTHTKECELVWYAHWHDGYCSHHAQGESEVHDLQTRCVCHFFIFLGEGTEGLGVLTTTRRIVDPQEGAIDRAVSVDATNHSCVDGP